MRALLYTINYAPELTGIGKYTGEMAEWLVDQGVEVTVVTAPPYYPAWRVYHPYTGNRYQREAINGVNVVRCPLWVPRRTTALKRLVHLASFAVTSFPVILWQAIRQRPDLILVVEPPLFTAPAARLAALLSGSKAWLHVQDFEVDAAFGLGLLRGGALQRTVAAVEGWLMRRFHCVSTISERMVERLSAKNVMPARTQLFPNWVELDRIYPLSHVSPLRAGVFPDDRVVVLYSGSMGKKHSLDTVVEAARLLNPAEDKIHFVFCGDGIGRKELETSARGAQNVTFWPLVRAERLNELLNLADIHVLPQRSDAEDLVFPSKLTNMLASGRPVVATSNPQTQIANTLKGCGVVVPPGDPQALADALRSLAGDEARRRRLGVLARRVAERLWDKDEVLTNAFAAHIGLPPAAPARAAVATTTAAVVELPPASPAWVNQPRPSSLRTSQARSIHEPPAREQITRAREA